MCTGSKTLTDCAFQMSPSMAVTSSVGQGDSRTSDIFKSCVLGLPGNAYNSDYELSVCEWFEKSVRK
jgi:hypothetical protein